MRKLAVGVVLAALLLTGCEGFREERGRGDAPVGSFDDSEVDVTNMADRFPNVATKCLHGADGYRVVLSSYSAGDFGGHMVVVEDESC